MHRIHRLTVNILFVVFTMSHSWCISRDESVPARPTGLAASS